MRACFVVLLSGCTPQAGEKCVSPEDTYGTTCSGGRLLHCEQGVWVDIGTAMRPDYSDPDVLGGPECTCERPNHVVCIYQDY